jgi:hypothetical protein
MVLRELTVQDLHIVHSKGGVVTIISAAETRIAQIAGDALILQPIHQRQRMRSSKAEQP